MNKENHTVRQRAAIVPRWFMDVLHEVIYADGQDGYLAVRALSAAIDARSPIDPPLLLEWACGRSQTEIADILGVSRHCICRRMNTLRRHFGDKPLRKLHGNKTAAEVLALTDLRHGKTLPNVRHTIERLASLSAMELCVLSAIMRRSAEDETLICLGISHTWYHTIKSRLSARFHIVPPSRKKVSISACIQTSDLLPFAGFTEKCTFSNIFCSCICILCTKPMLFVSYILAHIAKLREIVQISPGGVLVSINVSLPQCSINEPFGHGTLSRACRRAAPLPARRFRRSLRGVRFRRTPAAERLPASRTSRRALSPLRFPASVWCGSPRVRRVRNRREPSARGRR